MMITLNKICTDAEYMEYGFTLIECPLIREFDTLQNKFALGKYNSEEEREWLLDRMSELAKFLKLQK